MVGGRVFTQQDGDGVLALRALQADIGGLGARGLELCLGLGHIQPGSNSAIVAAPRQV